MQSGSTSRHPGYKEYYVDTDADIASLPSSEDEIAWGAVAFVIASGNVYVLNSEYIWVVI